MKCVERITPAVIEYMRRAIADAGGREVLFQCWFGSDRQVSEAAVSARGSFDAVLALATRARDAHLIVHNHPSGELTPSAADLEIAGGLAEQGVASWIIDNAVENVYAIVEPTVERSFVAIDPSRVVGYLDTDGPFAQNSTGFERRESQLTMVAQVAQALNDGLVCAIEAGTGVGKSLGYLVPIMEWVTHNHGRVVISTATITLQQQLIEKDIPFVKKLLKTNVQVALVKGRGNYVCQKRLSEAIEEEGLFGDPEGDLRQIESWAQVTLDGSKADLSFMPADLIWSRVNSDPDSCSMQRCRQRDDCFFMKARREAAAARVLVTNHHLLFADLSMRANGFGFESTAVLPQFEHLVVDEAHNIEQSATSFFSQSMTRYGVNKVLSRLVRIRGTVRVGLIPKLSQIVNFDLPQVLAKIDAVTDALDAFDRSARELIGDESTFRIGPNSSPQAIERLLTIPLDNVQRTTVELSALLAVCIDSVAPEDLDGPDLDEFRMTLRRVDAVGALVDQVRDYPTTTDHVIWLDNVRFSSGDTAVRLSVSPLSIAPFMQDAVFDPMRAIVFSSATLTVDGQFGFWSQRIGLDAVDPERVVSVSLPSPFDFGRRVLLTVPTDAPSPDTGRYQEYLNDLVTAALLITGGKGLVLFTSYAMLIETHAAVAPQLAKLGISVLRQGEDDRSRLLNRFLVDTTSVLFATDSFWEGVDAPGNTLEIVIICRLPFRVPSDPIFQARSEVITRAGGNAFLQLSLPDAVVRTKQGFGRLMRRTDDRGVVVVADPRIFTKRYGELFLSSLPQCAHCFEPIDTVLRTIERFLFTDSPQT